MTFCLQKTVYLPAGLADACHSPGVTFTDLATAALLQFGALCDEDQRLWLAAARQVRNGSIRYQDAGRFVSANRRQKERVA